MSKPLLRGLFFVAAMLFWSEMAQAKVYDPAVFTLGNGLQVIVAPNHRAPVVHQMLWYKVGSVDEAPGHSGLAHYLEHLMFKGTPSVPSGSFSKAVAAVGGQDNAFTSHEYTAYFATVPADFLPRLMELEADRMVNLSITEEQAAPERDVVLAERRQRTDDNPDGRFAEKFNARIYGKHPFGRPVIGWREEVEALDAAKAAAFYRQWYAPNNAVLVVAGDVTPDRALRLADNTFGKIPAGKLPPRADHRKLYAPRRIPDRIFVQDPDVLQVNIERRYTAPSYQDAQGKTVYALQVLEQILDGGAVGRLYRILVADKKVATETSAGYDPLSRDFGSFGIGLALPPKGNTGKATTALDEMLAALLRDGVTQEEVRLAVKRLREQAIFTRDHLMTAGYAFGQNWAAGLPVSVVEDWPDRIAEVTVDDVNKAARALFGGKDYVTGYLLPDKKAAKKSGGVRKLAMPQGDIR